MEVSDKKVERRQPAISRSCETQCHTGTRDTGPISLDSFTLSSLTRSPSGASLSSHHQDHDVFVGVPEAGRLAPIVSKLS